jgi:hypothetical protein
MLMRSYLALKGDQPTLNADVRLYLNDPAREATETHTTVDADNGRIETRTATVVTNIDWLQHDHKWPGLVSPCWHARSMIGSLPRSGPLARFA